MDKARSLRACLPQLKLMLRGDSSCQQALVSDWESDEECLCAVLRLAIECRSSGDPETSLVLLQWLRDQDVEHPLVLDNLIRGLIDSNRFTAATLLLPSLAALDQGGVLEGAIEALQIHQQTLLSNVEGHCQAQPLQAVAQDLLKNIPAEQLLERLFSFAQMQIAAGGTQLAVGILEELMQWGEWKCDDLPVELQQCWAALVVDLGSEVWQDLPSYRDALQRLKGADDVNLWWQRLEVELMMQLDIGHCDVALQSALQFLVAHPGHPDVLAWLAAQQDAQLKLALPGASADRVLAVDQAIARDELILDHLRKLVDLNVFSLSS